MSQADQDWQVALGEDASSWKEPPHRGERGYIRRRVDGSQQGPWSVQSLRATQIETRWWRNGNEQFDREPWDASEFATGSIAR